ncbi:N-acetyltransferase family protein [Actinoplanes sp. CA-030573]|uniref:GNAT family N-acetyltransferase n=1 Tax=Actinoplanes sp. CA-030573 TaxID=3239898 RepID=UPI003D8CC95E
MTHIRPITDADIDEVAALHVRAWRVGYAGIMPAEHLEGLDPARRAEAMRTRPPIPGSRTLVAVNESHISGFVRFGPYRREEGGIDESTGELYAIYVDPGDWGHGTGRDLLAAARQGLTEAGFPDMRLWVLTENHGARRFYEQMGLAPDGATQTYTPPGATAELPEMRYAVAL